MADSRDRRYPFCAIDPDRIILKEGLVLAIWDDYPLSNGHALIVPKRHVPDWFAAIDEEKKALVATIDPVISEIEKRYSPDGYNVGFNAGQAAGQTVFHLHLHVIPRYGGDVPDPRGGIRHVIPEKAVYWSDE